jgi:hypothetical protein
MRSDLGGGLILRRATREDAEAVAAFNLLFGYRSLEELDRAFADCRPGGGDARVLLAALFPRRPSDLRPVC